MSSNETNKGLELLGNIAKGDEIAFGAFVYIYSDSLYSYILKITKSEQWAEELVQDVWVQVWQAKATFALLDNPIAYLYRMAQNRSLDWIRKNKRELRLQYLINQQANTEAHNPIIEINNYESARGLISQAIDSLPDQRRKIFEYKQEGLSYEQIAQKLQISKNTVRNQLVSAFSYIREYLKRHGQGAFYFILLFFTVE